MKSEFDALAARLARHARRLAEAAAQIQCNPATAWRDARLVWPLFNARHLGD